MHILQRFCVIPKWFCRENVRILQTFCTFAKCFLQRKRPDFTDILCRFYRDSAAHVNILQTFSALADEFYKGICRFYRHFVNSSRYFTEKTSRFYRYFV